MRSFIRKIEKALFLASVVVGCVCCSASAGSEDIVNISSLEDLPDKSVGVLLGSTVDIMLTDIPDIKVMRYSAPAVILQSLAQGKIDAALIDSATTINARLAERGITIAFSGVLPAKACMGFRYQDENLRLQFNEYLAKVKADGSYLKTVSKWTKGYVDDVKMPEFSFDENTETLDIGIMSENMPFAFVNAEGFAGVEPELLNGFAQYIGRRPVYHEYEFASLVAGLQTGRVDLISGLIFNTPERAKTINFSDDYYQSANICLVREGADNQKDKFFAKVKTAFYNNLIKEGRYKIIFEGLWTTLVISFFSLILGTVLGALMAWRSRSKRKKLWHGILKVYGAIMHGVPLLVLLMMMFYVVFASSRLSAIWISVITFAIYFGYASCEIFNSGIDAVGKGQNEAARSLGFTKFGAFRYVVLPQAIKRIVPFYEGEAVTLIKETCLVGFIAVVDLTKATDIIQSRTFDAFFPLIIAAVIYFVIAWLLSTGLKCLTVKKHAVK